MAHFAQLDDSSTVMQVIVVNNAELITTKTTTTDDGYINVATIESEEKGIAFCQSIYGGETNWRQTSYNGNFRKNYAGIGFTFDAGRDAFIPPQPFSSWVLNEQTYRWDAPVPYPQDGKNYRWDEPTVSWIQIQE